MYAMPILSVTMIGGDKAYMMFFVSKIVYQTN